MYLIETASFILAIMLLHALLGKFGTLRGIFDKKVHAIMLREITGLHRRTELEKNFGAHDGKYRFTVTPLQSLAARPWWRWIFGNMAIEAGLIFLLIGMVFGNFPASAIILAVALIYHAITQFLVYRNFKSSKQEIEQEIAFKQKERIERFEKLKLRSTHKK